MKNFKFKTLQDQSTRELLAGIVNLFSSELTTLQKRILTEILVNNRSFSAIRNEIGLTLPRQKIIFQQGVGAVNKGLYHLNNLREAHQKLKEQHQELLDKFGVLQKKEDEMAKFSPEIRKKLAMPIEKIPFSHRVFNICKLNNINRVSDLVKYSSLELRRFRYCGKQSVIEVEDFLSKNGLYWGMLK